MSLTDTELSQQLFDLQSQLAFQEDTIQTLDGIVTRQQARLDQIEAVIEQLKAQLVELAAWSEREAPDQPPPHY